MLGRATSIGSPTSTQVKRITGETVSGHTVARAASALFPRLYLIILQFETPGVWRVFRADTVSPAPGYEGNRRHAVCLISSKGVPKTVQFS